MKFTEEHVWMRMEDDLVVIGMTEQGLADLGDIIFVDLPEEGDMVVADDPCVVIEGEEATAEMLAPLSGEIVEVNTPLTDNPALIGDDPMGNGWLIKIAAEDAEQMDDHLDEAEYKRLVG